jgi:hypothetical protein
MSLVFGNAPPPAVPSSFMRAVPQCPANNNYTTSASSSTGSRWLPAILTQQPKINYAKFKTITRRKYNNASSNGRVMTKSKPIPKRLPQVRKVQKAPRRCGCTVKPQVTYKRQTPRLVVKRVRAATPRRKPCN